MRIFIELITAMMVVVGGFALIATTIGCFVEAFGSQREGSGLYAIAGAILAGCIVLALAIYSRGSHPPAD